MFASRRLAELPPYFFSALDARVAELRAAGRSVIDLGRADPDHAAPEPVVAALARAAALPETHRYPPIDGVPEFRRAVARWYAERYGVTVDPDTEIAVFPGAREGLFLISLAACDPGDVALVPDPSFPAYRIGAYFAGAEVVSLPLRSEYGYLPDLTALPAGVARRVRLLFLNYPNNPTGATAPLRFFEDAAAFARRHGALLCHDLAYGESGYDGYRAPSLLQVEGAKDLAVEFITLSKSFCMPGWRLGVAVGGREAVAALLRIGSQVHGGVFPAVQLAGAAALNQVARTGFLVAQNETYRVRRDLLAAALEEVGLPLRRPRATPYLWLACPNGQRSAEYAQWLLERSGIALAPGSAFGAAGEGFLRLSLTASTAEIEEAAARLRRLGPAGLRPDQRPPGAAPTPQARPAYGWRGAVPRPADLGPGPAPDTDALLGSL